MLQLISKCVVFILFRQALLFILPMCDCFESNIKFPGVVFVDWRHRPFYYNYTINSNLTLIERTDSHWAILNGNGDIVIVNNHIYQQNQSLTIRQSSLERIPRNLLNDFHYTQKLYANNSNIKRIDADDFRVSRFLEVLDLSHNNISVVPAFAYTTQLKIINLSHNAIILIENGAFNRTTLLREIYLDNNQIAFLPDDLFVTNLEILSLHNNLLIEYSPYYSIFIRDLRLSDNALISFSSLSEYDKVNLSNTGIESIFIAPNTSAIYAENCQISDVLVTIPEENYRLKTLCLSNNLLTSIATLEYLYNLEVLNVSHNLLNKIDVVFRKFPNLRELNLSHNKLIEFDQQFLPHTVYLRYLDIGHNQLKHFLLKERADRLEILRIDGNGLTTIDSNLRQFAPALKLIGLNNNNFTCHHLTVSLLLLHYDGIAQVTSDAPAAQDIQSNSTAWGYVKGVRCINPMENYEKIIARNSSPVDVRKESDEKALKDEIMNAMESKIDRVQENTIKMVNNKFEELEENLLKLFSANAQRNSTN